MEAVYTLLGILVGSAGTLVIEWIRRGWQHEDRRGELLVAKTEEVAALIERLGNGAPRILGDAISGRLEPPPGEFYRLVMIVRAYLPQLDEPGKTLFASWGEFQETCSSLARAVMTVKGQPDLELVERATTAAQQVHELLVFTEAVGAVAREAACLNTRKRRSGR